MSYMTEFQMIEVLRTKAREYRTEIKGLKDMEILRCAIIKKLRAEIYLNESKEKETK